jgi:plasmid stabilization system protein ParE
VQQSISGRHTIESKKNQYSNAERVTTGIVKIIDGLIDHPEKYPPDKFKKDNPGNYRAFEKYSYRIAYKHTDKEIRILRIRHVKQEPKEY